MKVYVLTRIDSWERAEILGVFLDVDKAKAFAQKEEPDRDFSWEELNSGRHYVYPHLFTGPVYGYDLDEVEVTE